MSVWRNIFAMFSVFAVGTAAVLIGLGYLSLFQSLSSNVRLLPFLPWLGTVILIALILSFFRNAGIEFDMLRNRRNKFGSWSKFAFYYFLLFLLSASGLLRFGMYNFEGVTIARELTADLLEKFDKFSAKSDKIFATPVWDQFEKSARADFSKIKIDMDNPVAGYCAVGPVVRPEIDALSAKLPGFRFIAGTDSTEAHKCKDRDSLNRILSSYQAMFDNALINHPLVIEEKVKEKRDAKHEADAIVSGDHLKLTSVQDRLEKLGAFIFDAGAHDEVLSNIRNSNSDYGKIVEVARTYSPQIATTLDPGVNVDDLRDVQSPTAVYRAVLKRLLSGSTLLIAASAMVIDFIAILFVASARSMLSGRIIHGPRGLIAGTDIEYLWVPDLTLTEQ